MLLGSVTAGMGTAVAIPVAAAEPASTPAALSAPRATPRGDVSTLRWRSCSLPTVPTLQCGTLLVPYDYAKPRGRQFRLAVARVPATGKKTGSLFVNPGGPGGSGVQLVPGVIGFIPQSVRAQFDIVGWDPRGIGQTRPALQSCDPTNLIAPVSGPVNWPVARSLTAAAATVANAACQRLNAKFINYLGTNNVARDLDQLRAAVGDRKLTYWGVSYGTRIGYVYALKFPDRVRAMVLDGSISPMGNFADLAQVGGLAPDSAPQFLRAASPPTYNSIIATLNGLDAVPIDLGGGVQYTRWNYLTSMEGAIRYEAAWPGMISSNAQLETARLATPAGAAQRDRLRGLVDQSDGNLGGPFSVVNCLDYADRMTAAAQDAAISHNAAVAPIYGGRMTTEYSLGCSGLSLRPDPVPSTRSAKNRARIAALPVVIANATNDGSTPLVWAQAMRQSFARGALIKYRGAEHGLWMLTPSTCVNNRITNYFVRRKHPQPVTCPFAPAPGLPRMAGLLDGQQSLFPRSPLDASFDR
ncbi:MAG: alpha/beta fold hydrolase [Actinomycetes bacterium]